MKFFKNALLASCIVLVLIIITVSVIGYFQGRYADRQKTRLVETITLINQKVETIITPQAIEQKRIAPDILTSEQFPYTKMLYVSPVGDITFLSVNNQLVWLHPIVQNDKVVWTCYAAPLSLVAFGCSE